MNKYLQSGLELTFIGSIAYSISCGYAGVERPSCSLKAGQSLNLVGARGLLGCVERRTEGENDEHRDSGHIGRSCWFHRHGEKIPCQLEETLEGDDFHLRVQCKSCVDFEDLDFTLAAPVQKTCGILSLQDRSNPGKKAVWQEGLCARD